MSGDDKKAKRCRWGIFAFGLLGGIVIAVAVSATTRATDQAAFCGGCHSMAEAAWTHKQSVHARQDCNACHLPAALVPRMPMKAATGFHDIFVTLTNSVPPHIQASQTMKKVINDNCIRCHAATISKVDMTAKEFCTDCHRSVPHMNRLPVSQRRAADV